MYAVSPIKQKKMSGQIYCGICNKDTENLYYKKYGRILCIDCYKQSLSAKQRQAKQAKLPITKSIDSDINNETDYFYY